ncbi:penicillin acylase family protein [Steroidobacter flavus]|uniref:Penicillin acylase family protein n=1 Tax=Steroidobacter flavus TaxID=1842136 RepID=A0ABV8SKA2_9GAMM
MQKLSLCAAVGATLMMSSAVAKSPRYEAEITRTSYGVPHIKAKDEAGIGYGVGYAYAQDNVCMLAEEMVTVNGERSKYFGADVANGPDVQSGVIFALNRNSDFYFKWLNQPSLVNAAWKEQTSEVKALLQGYARGFNRFVADTGRANLPVACRNATWLRDLTELDLIKLMRRYAAAAGTAQFIDALVTAKPPVATRTTRDATAPVLDNDDPDRQSLASNAIALGKDATWNGRGVLFGNPHFPWNGIMRFYQMHLTIPGKIDVMGASLSGFPVVNIGFTQHFAWSHTVNRSKSATLYALKLDATDPTKYWDGKRTRSLVKQTLSIDVSDGNGGTKQESREFWSSEFGPVLHVPGQFEWSATTAYSLRDANFENNRAVATWYAMNKARSIDELQKATQTILGIPWVNTIAADDRGNALFAGHAVVANVSSEMLQRCVDEKYQPLIKRRTIVLRGEESCRWEKSAKAPQDGIVPGDRLPTLRRTDYVQNANDSAWLANASAPLVGFSPLISDQDYEQAARTRLGIQIVDDRLQGKDGLPGNKFDLSNLPQVTFNNRVHTAMILKDDLNQVCKNVEPVTIDSKQVDVQDACSVFVAWNGTAELDSVGYPLAKEWFDELRKVPQVFAVPFNAADPVNTPRGVKHDDAASVQTVKQGLARAILTLQKQSIDFHKPLRDVQKIKRDGGDIPVHGGVGRDVYNAIHPLPEGGLWSVKHGTSYLQMVGFDDNGPVAKGLLAYSQSTDPASPHYVDQTLLFEKKQWQTLPFTAEQIRADAKSSARIAE